ncbi:hypothetical protein CHUAL_004032 [Chamberlinius hualienensis]
MRVTVTAKVTMALIWLFLTFVLTVVSACRISEFYCDNGECVGLDKYCDGHRDCQDGSDETKLCTRCNRTYYGDRRKTYHMDLTDELLPLRSTYNCPLSFSAGGGELGDLVELSFDHFHIGRLVVPPPFTSVGSSTVGDSVARCVGGYMQIMERDLRPEEAGRWCGSSMGISVYYSETARVNVLIVLYPPDDWSSGVTHPASSVSETVELSLKFRFLSKAEAVTRYGFPQALIYRGEWIPNSVCDRLFQDCDSQLCRIHSPNFPGVTLRNVTCLYHITQRTIPRGHHAFIVVRQPNEDKISIQDSINTNVLTSANGIGDRTVSASTAREIPTSGRILFRHERKLIFGDSCVHDYVTVYNGYDINNAPMLARFCGNGALSRVIGNGPDMVIAFHSAPSDQLDQHTFELNIDVVFVPVNSVGAFIPENRRCEWTLNGEEQRSGIIRSLGHLAAPNTTCLYHFKGREHHRVWLYFVKYRVETGTSSVTDQGPVGKSPTIYGALYDGPAPNSPQNVTILAKFDDENRVKLCFHAKSFDHFIPLRPCRYPEESYVSTGPEMFFQYTYSPLFGLNYLHMEARYEFVDTHQDGEELPGGSGICDRVFSSNLRPAGTFTSPRNVFLFGRGGKKSLSCTYKFVGRSTETIRLTFHKVRLGNRKCVTVQDFHSKRFICQPRISNDGDALELNSVHHLRRNVAEEEVAEIKVSQILWSSGVEIPVACVCELDKARTLDLVGNVGYVNLTVTGMTSLQDFDNFYFEASYEFYGDVCDNGVGHVLDSNAGGEISIVATYDDLQDPLTSRLRCPWLIMANHDQYIHLKVPGLSSSEICDTNNRIIVFSVDESEPLSVICPANALSSNNNVYSRSVLDSVGGPNAAGSQQNNLIEIYSGNLTKSNRKNGRRSLSNTLLVEFHVIEPGSFNFRWSRGIRSSDRRLLGRKYRSEECANHCSNPSRDSSTSDLCSGGSKGVVTSFLFWTCQRSIKCSEDNESSDSNAEEDVASTQWENCVTSAHFPWLYIGIGIGCGVLVTVVLVASLLHRRREVKAKKGKPVPTDEYPMDNTKEIDC